MKSPISLFAAAAVLAAAPAAARAASLAEDFASPPRACRPETWFHFVDGNVSRAGITADLEAIAAAGIGGVQFFHGGMGGTWPGVTNPVYCLSREWDGCVGFVADECRRLGLTFKMQNCPGWSMAGGPWIGLDNTMRLLAFSRSDRTGPCTVRAGGLALPPDAGGANRDYRDIALVAFPRPAGAACAAPVGMDRASEDGRAWRAAFAEPFTLRTLVLPSVQGMNHYWCYAPGVTVELRADGRKIGAWALPQSNWQDNQPLSIAVPETVAETFEVSLACAHDIRVDWVMLDEVARPHNWESESARCLRAVMHDPDAPAAADAFVAPESVRTAPAGAALDLPDGRWTVLRVGHVNACRCNGPAPAEARGWECDKLSPRGVEANFKGYIGRIAGPGGPAEGRLDGMLLDSWECYSQTWTDGFGDVFAAKRGYALDVWWPALCGFVVGDRARTRAFLRDWRTLIGDTMAENFYGRMGELAHEAGLTVAFETASGDVFPGDIMSYFKYADTPMCEFWQPAEDCFVGSEEFKPVRPCASAAHLYGKPRVDAESFTSFRLTWDESFAFFKPYADRHFARGVTHNVLHTFTHNPQVGFLPPGTSFGAGIGSPFIRNQTWWRHMRAFTDYLARCTLMLERGAWRADALLYLGDEQDHKPPQRLPEFPEGYVYDYANPDVLHNRLAVRDGRLVTPEGLSYAVLWIRPGTFLSEKSRAKIDAFRAQGVAVCGPGDDIARTLAARLEPDLRQQPEADGAPLCWCHRADGDTDIYFVAAADGPFEGVVSFPRRPDGKVEVWDAVDGTAQAAPRGAGAPPAGAVRLALKAGESRFLVVNPRGPALPARAVAAARPLPLETAWTAAYEDARFAPGAGPVALAALAPWRDFPVGDEAKAYSGTVKYTAAVPAALVAEVLSRARADGAAALDLGAVEGVAKVRLGGADLGVRWCAPYRFDLARALPAEAPAEGLALEVEVTGTWFNRLVYDQGRPEKDRKTWTIRPPPANAPLRASGLLGPVAFVFP